MNRLNQCHLKLGVLVFNELGDFREIEKKSLFFSWTKLKFFIFIFFTKCGSTHKYIFKKSKKEIVPLLIQLFEIVLKISNIRFQVKLKWSIIEIFK